MVTEAINGKMDAGISVSGKIINVMERVSSRKSMDRKVKEYGFKINLFIGRAKMVRKKKVRGKKSGLKNHRNRGSKNENDLYI